MMKIGNQNQKKNEYNQDVDLYISLDKPFYYAGQQLVGTIYVNAKQNLQYTSLRCVLLGYQRCNFYYGKRLQLVQKQIYKNIYLISQIKEQIHQGHYAYPFSIMLPSQLTGSLIIRKYNNQSTINYEFKAVLSKTNLSQLQSFSCNVTIIQPLRLPITNSVGTNTTIPLDCYCCERGQSTLNTYFSTSAGKPGDKILAKIQVDNTKCQKEIKRVALQLRKFHYMSNNYGDLIYDFQITSQNQTTSIGAGQKANFQKWIQIPPLTNSTALGSLLGNYYAVTTVSQVDTCGFCCKCCQMTVCRYQNDPLVYSHIYIDTPTPQILLNTRFQLPANWNPIYSQRVNCKQQKPFNYQRNPKLSIMNRIYSQNQLLEL